MSFVHNTPVVVRKRKFTRSNDSLSRQNSLTFNSTQQKMRPRSSLHKGRNHWSEAPNAEDSTQKETGEAVRGLTTLAASFFGKMSGTVKKLLSPQENDAGASVASTETEESSTMKKRKVLELNEVKTPAKQSTKGAVTRERLDATTFKPEIKDKYTMSFAASPIPWDMNKLIESTGNVKSVKNSENYGTKFLAHNRKPVSKNIHSEHLQSVYRGTYKSPLLKSPSPSPSITSGHESVIQRISSLTDAIKTTFNRRSKNINIKHMPDLIFIKEQKLPPPTRSQLSLKFDDSQLTFADEYKYYQKKLQERQLEHERIHKEVLEASTKKSSSLIPKLTGEQEAAVIDIWKSRGKDTHLLVTVGTVDVYVRDFQTLADSRWLNDTVIEAYLKTIDTGTVHCFSSFFFTNLEQKGYSGVSKWMKRAKKQLKSLKRIVVPINISSTHWVSAVIDLEHKKIKYMDSLSHGESSHGKRALALLQEYLTKEAEKQGVPAMARDFEAIQIVDCPQQTNGSDCGVFTLMNLLHLSQGTELSYDSSEAKQFRRVIAHTILSSSE